MTRIWNYKRLEEIMSEILLLTKTLLKSSTNDSKQVGENKSKSFGRILFFILIYGYVIGFIGYISYYAIESLVKFGMPEIFFNFAFSILFGFGIIQTVISGLNILYFSKDLEFLLPLPLTSQKIVFAKLNCLVVSQYMAATLLVLPGIMIYGYILNLNILYYIIAILTLLAFPIIPVAIVSLLISVIMKFTKIIKNKDVVQYFTIILTLFLIVAVQSLSGTSGNPTQEELAANLIQSNANIEKYFSIFINIDLAVNTIKNYNNINGIINLAALASISFIVYYVVSSIISKMYVNTVISLKTMKKKSTKKTDVSKSYDSNKLFITYIKKEFKLLNRNPIFFMQCVLPIVFFPLIVGVPAIFGLRDSGIDFNVLQKDLEIIVNSNYGIMGFLITIIFMYIFNYTSVTAISRDGQNAMFMKYIPIDLDKQIIYKSIPGIILNLIPTIYISIFALFIIPSISMKTFLYVFVIASLINILNNILSIIVDLKNPKLKWISEYTVVKQNFNMIFSMLFVAIEIGIIIISGVNIKNIDNYITLLVTMFLILNIIVKKYIKANKTKIFEKII